MSLLSLPSGRLQIRQTSPVSQVKKGFGIDIFHLEETALKKREFVVLIGPLSYGTMSLTIIEFLKFENRRNP